MTTLIIGGGLSGLALADMLHRHARDYLLVEARSRFGGRIKTVHHQGAAFDMGPAWFWPGQPRIAALIQRLGLHVFDQHADGDMIYEDAHHQLQRGRGGASMQGSWRLAQGLATLTDALAAALTDGLPEARKRLNAKVTALAQTPTGLRATLKGGDTIDAARAVLALPPRIAAKITCTPALPPEATRAMQAVPTWMAGQAKAMAIYNTPFWRDAGLSGDAMSRAGPMVELHDASPAQNGPYALFGFIGLPPQARMDMAALRVPLTAQLARLYGPQAASPAQLIIKDWADDPHTATKADLAPLYAHPRYGLPPATAGLWDGRLLLSGTETAPEFGGYLEGALEAAEHAAQLIANDLT